MECQRSNCFSEQSVLLELTNITGKSAKVLAELWERKSQEVHRLYIRNQFEKVTELLDRPGMPGAMASWLDTLKDVNMYRAG